MDDTDSKVDAIYNLVEYLFKLGLFCTIDEILSDITDFKTANSNFNFTLDEALAFLIATFPAKRYLPKRKHFYEMSINVWKSSYNDGVFKNLL